MNAQPAPHTDITARTQAAMAAPSGQVPSPCIQLCQINPANGYCRGCWRNLHEIASWKELDDRAKRQGWREALMRSQSESTR